MEQPEKPETMIYTGPSMKPTFRQLDLLFLTPPPDKTIRRGDIIVFRIQGKKTPVIHRVLSIDGDIYRTRGDYNDRIDPYKVSYNDIIGSVHRIKRHNRLKPVRGGEWGYFLAKSGVLRLRRNLDRAISTVLHPFYRILSDSEIFCLFLPRSMKPKIYEYKKPGGFEYHLFLGKHQVGRRLAGETEWYIKRPFRLFIRKSVLKA